MNLPFFALFLSCLIPCLAIAKQETPLPDSPENTTKQTEQTLSITVCGNRWGSPDISLHAPVSVIFRNKGKNPLYLHDLFETAEGTPFGFDVAIRDSWGGLVVHWSLRCKIELSSPRKYIALEPGESYAVSLPLPKLLEKDKIKLTRGTYTMTVTYKNDLGQRCFKGSLTAKPVSFTVKE